MPYNCTARALCATGLIASLFLLIVATGIAQEQVDKLDPRGKGAAAIGRMTMRVRIVEVAPAAEQVVVAWRRGGEGLGGAVIRGAFAPDNANDTKPGDIAPLARGAWSAWWPLETVVGKAKAWEFPTITVEAPVAGK